MATQYKHLWKWGLLAAMVGAFVLPQFASSAVSKDVADARTDLMKKYEEIAKKMQDMNLVSGLPNGDFALGENLTRAQLVTVLVRAFGQESNAKKLGEAPSFSDVKANSWYSGYVSVAKQMAGEHGETLGRPDGSFSPNGNVTEAEALAFLMKFMGIKPEEGKSWPDNYISGAFNAGMITEEERAAIMDNKNMKATRGFSFNLAYNAFSEVDIGQGKTVFTTYVDSEPPILTVDATPKETDKASITVSGTATDAFSVSIGGNSVAVATDGKWSGSLRMKSGAQTYDIVASDAAGNTATKQVTIKMTGVMQDVYDEESLTP